MKNAVLSLLIVLVGATAVAELPGHFGPRKKPYYTCASTDRNSEYTLFLRKNRYDQVAQLQLHKIERGSHFVLVADRRVETNEFVRAPMGYRSTQYTGEGFVAVRTEGQSSDRNQTYTHTAQLTIVVESKRLRLNFNCQ